MPVWQILLIGLLDFTLVWGGVALLFWVMYLIAQRL